MSRPESLVSSPSAALRLQRTLPKPPERALQWRFEPWHTGVIPATQVLQLPGGRVFGEGIVITPENQVLSDASVDFRAPRGQHRLCLRRTLPRQTCIAGRLAVLASAEGNTYFHWLFDVVPRLQTLAGVPYDRALVECSLSFQQSWLGMLGIDTASVVPAVKHGHFKPDVLLVPSLPGTGLHVTPRSCKYLREIARQAGHLAPHPSGRRLYVSRSDAHRRRIQNEDALWKVLKARDFERLEPGQVSAADQIRLFSEAAVVVGPHGAGLSNLVFCAPGTQVLELFAPTYVNPCFWGISDAVGLRYAYLLGEGELPPDGPEPTSIGEDMSIDLAALELTLDILAR